MCRKDNTMIKEMERRELNRIMDIWLKTNMKAHDFIDRQYWIKNYDIVEKEYIPASKTFVYKEDSIIKGFISIMDSSFIGALFVLDADQGNGIGKKLLNHCKGLYTNLQLCVYVENTKAVKFYKNCGFKIKAEQPNEDSGYMEYSMSWSKG